MDATQRILLDSALGVMDVGQGFRPRIPSTGLNPTGLPSSSARQSSWRREGNRDTLSASGKKLLFQMLVTQCGLGSASYSAGGFLPGKGSFRANDQYSWS